MIFNILLNILITFHQLKLIFTRFYVGLYDFHLKLNGYN